MQFDDDIKPFNFADVLLLRYMLDKADSYQTVKDFNDINIASDLQWSFKSQISKFIRRFWKVPYTSKDVEWMQKIVLENNIKVKSKFIELNKRI